VAFSLVKGDRPDWAVQKLSEVGVDVIAPMVTARSVVRWDARRAERQHERLRTIAREAAMQCRRAWLPEVLPLTTPAQLAQRRGAALAQHGGGPLTAETLLVMVGPEGGWSEEEADLAVPTVGLGPHVLRAETAAVVAGALMCALRAGLVTPRAQPPPRVR
jgi:16S rRNA (uracil1498-N3)-methyltransferase